MPARRRRGAGWGSGMKDVVGYSIVGRTNWCRKMQAAVSKRFDEE